MEIWKNIGKIEGMEEYNNYEISNLGRVKSLNYNHTKKPKILKPSVHNRGYLRVTLCSNGNVKNFLIHRLVASAFIPNPNNYPDVNHLDENKQNNNVSNLEFCSREYNNNYGSRNERASIALKNSEAFKRAREKASEVNKKKIICVELNMVFNSIKEAAEFLNIHRNSISNVLNGKYKTSKGFTFKYFEE